MGAGRRSGNQKSPKPATQEAVAESGYQAPVLPTDMFSGLDLPGFGAETAQQHPAQQEPAQQQLPQPAQEQIADQSIRSATHDLAVYINPTTGASNLRR